MNKKWFVNVLVVVVVILAIAGYFILRKPVTPQTTQTTSTLGNQVQPASDAVGQNAISSEIKIITPQKGDQWQIEKNYSVTWRGGEGKISLFLQDKTKESSSDILKGNIWYRPNLDNTGLYTFNVGSDFRLMKGPFRFYIKDDKGNSVFSEYFSIIR